MRKHTKHIGYMVEVQEGLGNNWESYHFPSFCEMLDWFTSNEVATVLDESLRQRAMSQLGNETSFWTLGTPTCKVNGYLVTAGSVRYYFSTNAPAF